MKKCLLPTRWIIIILSGMNLFKIILEILLYGGLRVPFAQLFGIISFLTSILAFIPYNNTTEMIYWQWQLAAFSTLFQWFNTAFILRSVPFIGNFIVMFQSILINFLSLIFVILPLIIAFTIGTKMLFFNHSSFLTSLVSMHKLSAMIIGEFDYETLFFSKPVFKAAALLFIPFIVIMTIVFMNLLLGLTVGDIQSCMDNARPKASKKISNENYLVFNLDCIDAYLIRELIYIESTLPSTAWLKFNIIENEFLDYYEKDSILTKKDQQDESEDEDESLSKRQRLGELEKLLAIISMLCTQAKEVLEKENDFEIILKQLLAARKAQSSKASSTDGLNTSR